MSEADPNGMNLVTPRIHVKAGPQRVSAAFIQRFDGPVDDLMPPIDHTLADTQIGDRLRRDDAAAPARLRVSGPFKVTGVSDTPSRRKIFTCRPTYGERRSAVRDRDLRKRSRRRRIADRSRAATSSR